MNGSHSRWLTRRDLLAADEDLDPEARAVYEEARQAGQIAQAIYDRRTRSVLASPSWPSEQG